MASAVVETPQQIVPFLKPPFLARLRAALPPECLLTESEDTATYESDGLFHLHEKPLAVVLPQDEAQVIAVLQACRDFGVPIVPRGAGTGLAGGALPHRHGILMSLTITSGFAASAPATNES